MIARAELEYVECILDAEVRVRCSPSTAAALGYRIEREQTIGLPYESQEALVALLVRLQGLRLPFSTGRGWEAPAEVFVHFRDRGLLEGSITRISWLGPSETVEETI